MEYENYEVKINKISSTYKKESLRYKFIKNFNARSYWLNMTYYLERISK